MTTYNQFESSARLTSQSHSCQPLLSLKLLLPPLAANLNAIRGFPWSPSGSSSRRSSRTACPSKKYLTLLFKAAQQIRINYSTAKTILFLYRRKHKFLHEVKLEPDTPTDSTDSHDGLKEMAGFRQGLQHLMICCSIGGVASVDSPSQFILSNRTKLPFELWFSLIFSQSH